MPTSPLTQQSLGCPKDDMYERLADVLPQSLEVEEGLFKKARAAPCLTAKLSPFKTRRNGWQVT